MLSDRGAAISKAAHNESRKGRPDGVDGVIVCGMPHSGNRLVLALCGRIGFKSHTTIWHGPVGPKQNPGQSIDLWGPNIRALIPVRDTIAWGASWGNGKKNGFVEPDFRAMVMRELSRFAIPTMIFTYESIVRDSLAMAREICAFLEVDEHRWPTQASKRPWGREIYDGNERRLPVAAGSA